MADEGTEVRWAGEDRTLEQISAAKLPYKSIPVSYCMVTGLKMAIKGILKEELENSIRMRKRYEEELTKLPRGSLIKKKIKGHEYYYIVMRENGKVKFKYEGKKVSKARIKEYERAKALRAKYRRLLSQVKKQIKFLERALRGHEAI